MPLSGNQRRYLRSLAHHKNPVVQIGRQGLTPTVTAAVEVALHDHELIKLKMGEAVGDRSAVVHALVKATGADWVQSLGRTVLLYKPRQKKPEIKLPQPHGTPTSPLPKLRGAVAAVAEGDAAAPAPEEEDDADEDDGDDEDDDE